MRTLKAPWSSLGKRIDRAHRRIIRQIWDEQVTRYTPEQIASRYPNGYDLSTVKPIPRKQDYEPQYNGVFA